MHGALIFTEVAGIEMKNTVSPLIQVPIFFSYSI
jgi:hypothetical protein